MTTTTHSGNGPNPIFLVVALLVAALLIYIFYTAFIPSLWDVTPVSSGYDYLVN